MLLEGVGTGEGPGRATNSGGHWTLTDDVRGGRGDTVVHEPAASAPRLARHFVLFVTAPAPVSQPPLATVSLVPGPAE